MLFRLSFYRAGPPQSHHFGHELLVTFYMSDMVSKTQSFKRDRIASPSADSNCQIAWPTRGFPPKLIDGVSKIQTASIQHQSINRVYIHVQR